MAKQEITIDISRDNVLAPLIAAQLTNAFYCAELLHARTGMSPPREDVHHEVLKTWLDLTAKVVHLQRQAEQ